MATYMFGHSQAFGRLWEGLWDQLAQLAQQDQQVLVALQDHLEQQVLALLVLQGQWAQLV